MLERLAVYCGLLAVVAGFWFLIWSLSHVILYACVVAVCAVAIVVLIRDIWTGKIGATYPSGRRASRNLEFDLEADLGKDLI